jgi:hypothetical protein
MNSLASCKGIAALTLLALSGCMSFDRTLAIASNALVYRLPISRRQLAVVYRPLILAGYRDVIGNVQVER